MEYHTRECGIACFRFIMLALFVVILPSAIATTTSNEKAHEGIAPESNKSLIGTTIDCQRTASDESFPRIIHLAFICGGQSSTRSFYTLLKSILFHRSNHLGLELHMFVDEPAKRTLKRLFSAWRVANLQVHYYDQLDYSHLISWIPNEHYSQDYGLLKLVVPSVLATKGIQDVVMLDTDMLALGDIADLITPLRYRPHSKSEWPGKHRDDPGSGAGKGGNDRSLYQVLGIVENQSDWYKDNTNRTGRPAPWRALGRGFNTGVMRFDLARLKLEDWEDTWREVAHAELVSQLKTTLADQDILNAVIYNNPDIVVPLSCQFNLQLNENTDLDAACPGHVQATRRPDKLRLIHWNSPHKLDTQNLWAEYYRDQFSIFQNLDAKLLSDRSHPGNGRATSESFRLPEGCRDIRPRPSEPLRTFIFFMDSEGLPMSCCSANEDTNHVDVTLVTHLSLDRIRALDDLAAYWAGPISVAIYLSEAETSTLVEAVRGSETLAGRNNIGYHLAFKDQGMSYPINRLRNLALEQVLTGYVYLTDVDFVPAAHLYQYLREAVEKLVLGGGNHSTGKKSLAFVVPAFESRDYKFDPPRNKSDLLRRLELGTVNKFRDTIWPQGQAATLYDKWKQATKPFPVKWQPDYEPFIVTHRDVPPYDERFVGFGWNKVEHIMLLAAKGYEFYVLPEAFAVHQVHAASFDIGMYRRSREYQFCIKSLKEMYTSELRQAHPDWLAGQLDATNLND